MDAQNPARRRAVGRLRFAAGLTGAAVIAAGIAFAVSRPDDKYAGVAIDAQPLRSHVFDGLTVRYPASWRVVDPTFASGGAAIPMGYVLSQDPLPQCRPATGCGAPLTQLDEGASAVLVYAEPNPDVFTATARIGGWPAQWSHDLSSCVAGTAYARSVRLLVSAQETIEVVACTARTQPVAHRTIDHIVSTVRYRDRTAVTISGRLVASGMGVTGPQPGRVFMTPVGGKFELVLPVGRSGRYSGRVPAGSYLVSGRAIELHIDCWADGVDVRASQPVNVDVICPLK